MPGKIQLLGYSYISYCTNDNWADHQISEFTIVFLYPWVYNNLGSVVFNDKIYDLLGKESV
ncbi:MAG TPA: hypothetical protein DEO84_01895 [candidate division Zixibacteria bacterium]|nr:hypothetical protein [candidate division Zixibacteria bacterium]